MLTRRDMLWRMAAGSLALGSPSLSLARAATDARLVMVILRGAMDGLALAPPYGDGRYAQVRGTLALAPPGDDNGIQKLDGLFGLHPALPSVADMYAKGDAAVFQAIASPYRERSHFDGQDVLENGSTAAHVLRNGWLNRALQPLGGKLGDEAAIALAPNTPLLLRGDNSVTSWAPSRLPDTDDDTLARLQRLYAADEFFRVRLAQAIETQAIAASGNMDDARGRRRGGNAARLKATMQQAARFLTTADGPRIAVVESGGWDTHANQGLHSGSLANSFAALDSSLAELRAGLAAHWTNTVVMVVTEFGRTARPNGTRGTDHGTATAALMLGGAVRGGRVIADWPGLAPGELLDNRDLQPTTDVRSVFKGVLIDHLGLSETFVAGQVFPDSASVRPMQQLIRS